MSSPSTPDKPAATEPTTSNPTEGALRPFQAASMKFLQASMSLWETAMRKQAQLWLDLHAEVRRTEQEAYQATMAVLRKHMDALGQAPATSPEEMYSARIRSHFDHEKETRQIAADTQAKLTATVRKLFGDNAGEPARQLASQRQDAYQAYLGDLQQAWSATRTFDPQTMTAIASNILFTINAAGQYSQ